MSTAPTFRRSTSLFALLFAAGLVASLSAFGCSSEPADSQPVEDDAEALRKRCGDGRCSRGETCGTCPADCGVCGGSPPDAQAPADGSGGANPGDAALSEAGGDAAGPLGPVPDGGAGAGGGLAAKYPGDIGIASDPDVIFADDFESYSTASDLSAKWTYVYQQNRIRFDTNPANVKGGTKALEFTIPQGTSELSNAVQRVLSTKLDVVYFRYYSKFDSAFDVVGSSHNGSFVSGGYFTNGSASPGVPANGTNKFLVAYECGRESSSEPSPGALNAYVYHPEQRDIWGDHFFPTGTVLPFSSQPGNFGSQFVSRPNVTPALDRYYAYEVMVKLNTPGQRDGRITFWLDGNVIADFPNMRFRDITSLKIDALDLAFHSRSNPATTRKWYDNVVVAKRYIGPMP